MCAFRQEECVFWNECIHCVLFIILCIFQNRNFLNSKHCDWREEWVRWREVKWNEKWVLIQFQCYLVKLPLTLKKYWFEKCFHLCSFRCTCSSFHNRNKSSNYPIKNIQYLFVLFLIFFCPKAIDYKYYCSPALDCPNKPPRSHVMCSYPKVRL